MYQHPNIYLGLGFEFEFGPQRIRDLAKGYYIDGQNTQLIIFEIMTTEGVKMPTQITPLGWIFWTMIFYNLKKLTSRSI